MMRRLGLVLVAAVAGCTAEPGDSLQIVAALAPTAECTFDPTGDALRSVGSYDPRGYGLYQPASYLIGLRVLNNMVTPETDPAVTTGDVEVRSPANDVLVSGVEACWDLAAKYTAPGAFAGGNAFACDGLPADQRGFMTTSTAVQAEGEAAVVADVLPPSWLQAAGIFGPDFDPRNLPTSAVQATAVLMPTFSLPVTESPVPDTRSGAWGTFPHDPLGIARVLVQLRVVGKTQTGMTVHSNWITYPIDVEPGALATACGPAPEVASCGTAVGNMYVGWFVDLGTSCLPYRGGVIACTLLTTDDCPTAPTP